MLQVFKSTFFGEHFFFWTNSNMRLRDRTKSQIFLNFSKLYKNSYILKIIFTVGLCGMNCKKIEINYLIFVALKKLSWISNQVTFFNISSWIMFFISQWCFREQRELLLLFHFIFLNLVYDCIKINRISPNLLYS